MGVRTMINGDDTEPDLVNFRHRVLALEANSGELVKRGREIVAEGQRLAEADELRARRSAEHHKQTKELLEAIERQALAVSELSSDLQPRSPNGRGEQDDIPTQDEHGRQHDDG